MWRLLKAEFNYNRFQMVILYAMITLTFFTAANLERNGILVDPSSLIHLIAIGLLSTLFTTRFIEKRTRYHNLLPLAIHKHGIARFFFQLLFWLGVMVIYLISQLRFDFDTINENIMWRLLALNNILLSANAAYLISYDLWPDLPGKSRFGKSVIIIFLWLYVLATGLFYMEKYSFHFFKSTVPGMIQMVYFTPAGVALLFVMSLVLSYWSFVIFQRRQQYL